MYAINSVVIVSEQLLLLTKRPDKLVSVDSNYKRIPLLFDVFSLGTSGFEQRATLYYIGMCTYVTYDKGPSFVNCDGSIVCLDPCLDSELMAIKHVRRARGTF